MPNQNAQVGAPFLLGQVIDGRTRVPVPDAVVDLSPYGRSSAQPRVLTDSQGRFVFRNIAPGEYRLAARAQGYLDGGYGQVRPNGPTSRLVVSGGRAVGDIEIRLWKPAAIHGRVLDHTGQPTGGVIVRAFRLRSPASSLPIRVPSATTDDRGDYALTDLAPGDYVVGVPFVTVSRPAAAALAANRTLPSGRSTGNPLRVAVGDLELQLVGNPQIGSAALLTSENGRLLVRPTAFLGGASSPDQAEVVTLQPGESRVVADMTLRVVPSVSVTGAVVGAPQGDPLSVSLRLPSDRTTLADDFDVARTDTFPDGRFTLLGVPAGRYLLVVDRNLPTQASSRGAPGPASAGAVGWAREVLAVGAEDVGGVAIQLRPGLSLRGRIAIDASGEAPPTVSRLGVYLNSPGRSTVNAQMSANFAFALDSILPGAYTFDVNVPPGWVVGWIEIGGRRMTARAIDVSDNLNDIVLVVTSRFGVVHGRLPSSEKGAQFRVLLFPADRRQWAEAERDVLQVREEAGAGDSDFSFSAVPPGDYLIVAVQESAFDSRWRDPSKLAVLATTAVHFSVADRETKAVVVPVRGGR